MMSVLVSKLITLMAVVYIDVETGDELILRDDPCVLQGVV